MIKVDPCKSCSKYISRFLYCINLKDIDSVFYNFLTKPYGIIRIVFLWGVNCGWKVIAKIKFPALYLWIETLIVVSPMAIPTYFLTDLVISITGNSYLKLWAKSTISAYIVERDVSVCNFDCHKTGQSENVIV